MITSRVHRLGVALALSGCLAGALSACASGSSKSSTTSAGAAAQSSTAPVKVTLVTADVADPFFISQQCGAQAAAKKYNVNFAMQGTSSLEYQQELSVFNAVVTKHPDVIALVPFSATAFVAPVQQALASGIKIVLDGATLASPLGAREFVTAELQLGALAADGLAKEIGGKGEVAIESTFPDLETAINRAKGFQDEIAKKYPGIKVVTVQYNNGDSTKTAENVAALLQAHPSLAGIFAVDTGNGEATASALQANGAQNKVKLVSYDAAPQEVTDLKSGVIQGLVAQDPYQYGYDVVQYAAQLARGQVKPSKADYTVTLGGAFIDKSNVNSPSIQKYLYTTSCPA